MRFSFKGSKFQFSECKAKLQLLVSFLDDKFLKTVEWVWRKNIRSVYHFELINFYSNQVHVCLRAIEPAHEIIGKRRLRQTCAPVQSRQSLHCSHALSMEVDEGSNKNQTSSPTGWLSMSIWRMSLQRMKSTLISWDGSISLLFSVRIFKLFEYLELGNDYLTI